MKIYKDWYSNNLKSILDGYKTYLKFPSVSAQQKYKQQTRECANWIENYLASLGFKTTQWQANGHPTVFGCIENSPQKPTLLFYGHYDVQPPEPLELWKSLPFEPEIRENRMYARGAEDNKGQCFYTITAIRAFMHFHKEFPFNIKFLIEGEEEMGSTALLEVIDRHKEELKADYLFVVDSSMGSLEKPSLTLGCRGIMTMDLKLTNLSTDVHSGHYGGVAYNPIRALCETLAKVIDSDGKVQIPGFYDNLHELTVEEKKKVDLSFDPDIHRKEVGIQVFHKERGYNPTEVSFLRPVFEINGISGGYAGEGFKTVLPKEAVAKISCRLVPNQDPKKIYDIVSKFLKENVPDGMKIEMHFHGGGPAIWSDPSSEVVKLVEKAYREVFNNCFFIYTGGSIPVTASLKRASSSEVVCMGTGLDRDNIHAPNENFGLDQFENGYLIIAKILESFCED
jgi:acetylornithine deacetylase/succinyl-diaminopimelate desuccinylase-like protein